jgi:hypothetical protein
MRKGAKVRTRHEVEFAAFYKRHKGGTGALNRRIGRTHPREGEYHFD